ncbi:MAG: hypothetical protein IPM23_02440 [Candidatus Melainabacteria bacterium]|nr:hypothetical protein [Candidatus Melainabacteria bacterium]
MKGIFQQCVSFVEKMFAAPDNESRERIEGARITSTRLDALKRMRESANVPEYKLDPVKEPEPAPGSKQTVDDVSLTFGME